MTTTVKTLRAVIQAETKGFDRVVREVEGMAKTSAKVAKEAMSEIPKALAGAAADAARVAMDPKASVGIAKEALARQEELGKKQLAIARQTAQQMAALTQQLADQERRQILAREQDHAKAQAALVDLEARTQAKLADLRRAAGAQQAKLAQHQAEGYARALEKVAQREAEVGEATPWEARRRAIETEGAKVAAIIRREVKDRAEADALMLRNTKATEAAITRLRAQEAQARAKADREAAQARNQEVAMAAGAVGVGAGVVSAATLGAARDQGQVAMAFDREMRNVNSLAQLGDAQLADLSAKVVGLTRTLPASAKELAAGLYNIQSSGFEGAEGLKVLEIAGKSGAAGLSTTATAAKALTGTLNAYHLAADQAGRVSDVLFQTVNFGDVNFEGLAQNLGDVTATAAAAGVPIEAVGAAIALMTKNGMQAPQAFTALAGVLNKMLAPSEQAQKTAKALGIDWFNAAGVAAKLKAVGLEGVMAELAKKTGGAQAAMRGLFEDTEAMKGATHLMSQAGREYTAMVAEMGKASGATEKAFQEQQKAYEAQWQMVQNAIERVKLILGSQVLQLVTPFAKTLQALAEGFEKLPAPVQRAVGVLELLIGLGAGLAAAGAGLGLMAFGIAQLAPGFAAAGTALTAVTGAIAPLATGLAGLALPIAGVVAAVGLLAAAWYTDLGGIREFTADWASELGDAFVGLGQNLQATFETLGAWLQPWWAATWTNVSDEFKLALGTIDTVARGVFQFLATYLRGWGALMAGDLQGFFDTWTTAAQTWADGYAGVFTTLWSALQAGARGHFGEMVNILREGQAEMMASAIARGEAMLNGGGIGSGGSWAATPWRAGATGFSALTGGTDYAIASPVGMRRHPIHRGRDGKPLLIQHDGTDRRTPQGTPMTAPSDGVVTYAGPMGGYGNVVDMKFGELSVRIAHLSKVMVETNQQIRRGQIVALSGGAKGTPGAGTSTGPHSHAEVRLNGVLLNTPQAGAALQRLAAAPQSAAGSNPRADEVNRLLAAQAGASGRSAIELALDDEKLQTAAKVQTLAQELKDVQALLAKAAQGSKDELEVRKRIAELQAEQARQAQHAAQQQTQAASKAQAAAKAAAAERLRAAQVALSITMKQLDAELAIAKEEGFRSEQAVRQQRLTTLEAMATQPQMQQAETSEALRERIEAERRALEAMERERSEGQARLDQQLLQQQATAERASLAQKLAALQAQQTAELLAAKKTGLDVLGLAKAQADQRSVLTLEHQRGVLAAWEQQLNAMLGLLDVWADSTRTIWAKLQSFAQVALGLVRDELALALGPTLDALGKDLAAALGPVREALKAALAPLAAQLAGAVTGAITAAGAAAAGLVAALNPVTLTIGGAVVAAGGLAWAFKAAGDAAAEAARKAAALNTEAGLLEAERSENPYLRSEAKRRRAQQAYDAAVAEANGTANGGVVNAWGPEGPPLEVALKLQAAQAKLFADLAAIGAEDETRRLDAAGKLAALNIQMAEANGDEAMAARLRFEEEVLRIRQEVAALERDGAFSSDPKLAAQERAALEDKLIQEASDRIAKERDERREGKAREALQEMERNEKDAIERRRKALQDEVAAKKAAAEAEIEHIDRRQRALAAEQRTVQAIVDARRKLADEEKARFNEQDKAIWAQALSGITLGDDERTYEALDVRLQTAQASLDLEEIGLAEFQAIAQEVYLKRAALARIETNDSKVEAKERERIRRIEAESYQAWQQLQLEQIDTRADAELSTSLSRLGQLQAESEALGLRRQIELDVIADVDEAYSEHFKGLEAMQNQAIKKWEEIWEAARKASAVAALGGATAGPAQKGDVRPNMANPSQMLKWDGTRWNVAATGGLLAGGVPGVDSIPVLAQSGELIVSNDLTKRLQAFLGNPWDYVMPTLAPVAAAAASSAPVVHIHNPILFDRAMLSSLSEQVSREIARNL